MPPVAPLAGLRFGLPRNIVRDGIESVVADIFDAALQRLSKGGATIVEFDFDELNEIPVANAKGGFAVAEAWALHSSPLGSVGAKVTVPKNAAASDTSRQLAPSSRYQPIWVVVFQLTPATGSVFWASLLRGIGKVMPVGRFAVLLKAALVPSAIA